MSGELADFAEPYGGVWLQVRDPAPRPRSSTRLSKGEVGAEVAVPDLANGDIERARAIIDVARDERRSCRSCTRRRRSTRAPPANGARAAANLAIALRGERAAESLFVLPTEANVNGARDMGVDPSGARAASPAASRA